MNPARIAVLAGALSAISCSSGSRDTAPAKRLGNPVLDARVALSSGDSTLLAVGNESVLPGIEGTGLSATEEPQVRLFSRRSLNVSASAWLAQRDSLTVYAAAYNRVISEARLASR